MAPDPLREAFAEPDPEYGPVPLWWWDGEALDPDRLTAQLEALSAGGVPSVCFISKYPNGPAGDEQRYFSEEWWDCLEHVARECDRLGMELWVHDETYHHSPPDWREYWGDALRAEATERPELRGRVLHRVAEDVGGGETATLDLPGEFEPLSVAAYPRGDDGTLRLGDAVELGSDGAVEWTAPDGEWHVAAVGHRPEGLCYTNRAAVERYVDLHYEEYARRLGDLVGDVLAGTFEDELVILDGEVPCDRRVLERFREAKGYDPDLIALYEETDATTTLRTDYYDVVTTLLEECWFEPLHEWHEAHDMLRAHDNWGRNDLAAGTEQYGDYYRTMRWYSAPGYDDGGPAAIGSRNFFDAKLAASIAACYDRERVWGELFHSTGWGFAPDDQLAGVVENVCYGCNLYDKHGLYYTTLGGWWAHAPGDVHFRQPYWGQVDELNDAATRLCSVFGRGHPVVDAALAVPTASLHADWHPEAGVGEAGNEVDAAARGIAESLYGAGTDLVLADPESLADAAIGDGALGIADMSIPVLVLPPTTAIERATVAAARDLHDAGGIVMAVGRLPATAVGDGDADLDAVLDDLFDGAPGDAIEDDRIVRDDGGGAAILAGRDADLSGIIGEVLDRDVRAPADVSHAHRRIGDRDAYLLFNARDAERAAEVGLRADGRPERWDPLTGETAPIHAYERDGPYARLDLTFAPHGHHLIVFGPADEEPRAVETSLGSVDAIEPDGERVTVRGTARSGEAPSARVVHGGTTYVGTDDPPSVPEPIAVEGWEFEPDPVLDNRWGDFRYPPSGEVVGPEVRRFRHRAEAPGEDGREQGWHRADVPDDGWEVVEPTYGPYFWRHVGDPSATPDESRAGWEPYAFSKAVGRPGTHPYFLGYASIVSEEFLVAGDEVTHFWTTVRAPADGAAAIQHGPGIRRIELGERTIEPGQGAGLAGVRGDAATLEPGRSIVHLPAGETAARIAVEPGVETHFAVEPAGADARERDMESVPRVRWFRGDDPYVLDYAPWDDAAGWYRFDLPAGTAGCSLPVRGDARVWIDGEERPVEDGRVSLPEPVGEPTPAAVRVEGEPGAYGGAAWTGPVSIDAAPVAVDLGPWEDLGLESYSGRGRYRATATLPELAPEDRVVLDLGDVGVSAAVRVNGEPAGASFSRPFEVEITDAIEAGENDLAVTVANTLANHFAAETPKRYVREGPLGGDADDLLPNAAREETISGLLGPVAVRIERGVAFEAGPE